MNDLEPTPPQRLAASRKAIIRYMAHDERPEFKEGESANADGLEGYGDVHTRNSTWVSIKHTAKVWWQHHPAQLALGLAKPALGRFAEEKPLQLLCIAAGIGAATAVLRPWRLISVTGLLFAAIKASDMPVLLMSILSAPEPVNNTKDAP